MRSRWGSCRGRLWRMRNRHLVSDKWGAIRGSGFRPSCWPVRPSRAGGAEDFGTATSMEPLASELRTQLSADGGGHVADLGPVCGVRLAAGAVRASGRLWTKSVICVGQASFLQR